MERDYIRLCEILNEIKRSANYQKEMISRAEVILEKYSVKRENEHENEYDPDENYVG